jgi:hypothetical protein
MAPTIVTRAQWGARAPKGAISMATWGQRVGVAIHHSAGVATQTVRQIQDYQMDSNGWVDIGYNFLATQDGRLWEGRQGTWSAIGAHAANENTAWVGVCWIGTSGNVAPTAAALSTLAWVREEAQRRAGRQLLVSGHGQLPGQATECPGSRLRAWIAAGLPTEGDDMTKAEMLDVLTEFFSARYSQSGLVDDDTVPAGWNDSLRGRIAYAGMTAAPRSRARFAADVWTNATGTEVRAALGTILAAVAGDDVAATLRAELDKAAVRERTERAAEREVLLATLTEVFPGLVAEHLADVPAEQVRTAVMEGLATLRLVAEPT